MISPSNDRVSTLTALHAAAEQGHYDVCALLLKTKANPNAIDCYGSTPLALSCRAGHPEVATLLLQHGADPSRRSHQGFSPLLRACSEATPNHERCVEILLEHGADVLTSKTPDGRETALVFACRQGNLRSAALLVKATCAASLGSEHGDRSKCSALVASCGGNHVGCARLLLEEGKTPPDCVGAHEMTPLMAAACSNSIDCLSLLLRGGACIDHRAASGGTALLLASMRGHDEAVKLLCRFGAKRTRSAGNEAASGGGGGSRGTSASLGVPRGVRSDEEIAAKSNGHERVAAWLAKTRGWDSPLHFVQSLSVEEVRAELRAGGTLGGFAEHGAASEGYLKACRERHAAMRAQRGSRRSGERSTERSSASVGDGDAAQMEVEAEAEAEAGGGAAQAPILVGIGWEGGEDATPTTAAVPGAAVVGVDEDLDDGDHDDDDSDEPEAAEDLLLLMAQGEEEEEEEEAEGAEGAEDGRELWGAVSAHAAQSYSAQLYEAQLATSAGRHAMTADVVWPVEVAEALRLSGRAPSGSAAELVLRAAAPWSPGAHELWPEPARRRAVELLRIGYALAWGKAMGALGGDEAKGGRLCQPAALLDVWRDCVMPEALRRCDGVVGATDDAAAGAGPPVPLIALE